MSMELGEDYFSHPLTTESFDRTKDQRAERAMLVADLYRRGEFSESKTNEILFDRFLDDLNKLIVERETTIFLGEVKNDDSTEIVRETGIAARAQVLGEITLLNEAISFPQIVVEPPDEWWYKDMSIRHDNVRTAFMEWPNYPEAKSIGEVLSLMNITVDKPNEEA